MRTLVLALLPLAMGAQPSSKQTEVDRIFSAFNNHTPGCAVGVAQNGNAQLTAGYGMADLERNVPITPGTVFESGSVAKQFTAAALMLLAQQGKISLDDPMSKYLPELTVPFTIRQVLSHVSGIREWRPIATFGGREEGTVVYTNHDLLNMAAKQRALNFDPGTAYSYTNTGFNISTILIERVTGQTFPQYTDEQIFKPLGMTHSRWRDDFRKIVPHRALAYGFDANKILVQQTPIENIIGAGGLLTTVEDLLKWNENFVHAKVGGPEFVKAQQTPAKLTNGKTINYAAGLTVTADEVSHSGSTGGYRTWLGRYPAQKVSVAVLCNNAQANPTVLGRETARLWTGAPAHSRPAATYSPSNLQELTGMYRKMRDNTVIDIRVKDGNLVFGPTLDLVPVAPHKFRTSSEGEFTFEGHRLTISSPTGDISYERIEVASPPSQELQAFVGSYRSSETDSTIIIASSDQLSYKIGTNPPVTLKPTFRDTFSTPTGVAFHFVRDASGKPTTLSIGEDRVWDLRFTR